MSTATKASDLVKAAVADRNPEYLVTDADLGSYNTAQTAISDKITTLVKGVGYARTDKPTRFGQGGNEPLTDPDKVFNRAMRAEKAWTGAIKQGLTAPDAVYKSLSPAFRDQFGAFLSMNPQNMMMSQLVGNLQQQVSDALGKSITLTTPLSTGLVPYNLVAPSRLIYPVDLGGAGE